MAVMNSIVILASTLSHIDTLILSCPKIHPVINTSARSFIIIMEKKHNLQSLKEAVSRSLPDKYSHQGSQIASSLFDSIDTNKNGYASLAEIDNGLKSIANIPPIPGLHTILIKAYDKARVVKKSNMATENKYVTRDEFIYMLIYLRIYYEFYMEFTMLDDNDDHKITLQEMEKGKGLLQKWRIDTSNLLGLFKQMDQDGKGTVSFREFCNWGINKYFAIEFGAKE